MKDLLLTLLHLAEELGAQADEAITAGRLQFARPSPTLSRGFTRLDRFLAPYGLLSFYYRRGRMSGRPINRTLTPEIS